MGNNVQTVNPDLAVVDDLRRIIRSHQLRLIETQDKTDPWWFLVDPEAPCSLSNS